ncbi:MAG: ABC transporter ATP-binding protein [Sneathiellaceae bacterium]
MTAPAAPLLQVEGLSKRFGGLQAVNQVGFSIAQGQIYGLIGPNGSGKTTVMNLLTGELPADSGTARLQGDDLIGRRPHEINRRRVARTFQLVRVLGGMTVRENVLLGRLYGAEPTGRAAAQDEAEQLIAEVGLAELAGQAAGQLTYIDQKRLELARALATRPVLLLLDEWLAGLNPTELQVGMQLIETIRDRGVTVLMVEHVMHAIRRLCDRVAVMNAGSRIAEGLPDEVLADPEVVRAYLGDEDDEEPAMREGSHA